jgi:peptidoglycan/LPS O-acetylase OafA/YrhL
MKNSQGEIDGLRVLAVMGVLLFHAPLGLPGGFVGVDVFFVISGYLITSLMLKDSEAIGGFSILGFWERRIRRILPSLLVVVVGTAVGGWFILLPTDFHDLGNSILAQAVFGGNVYFWLTRGYFDTATSTPLLHTWSLAVEQQFYLLFPLLFLFGAKLRSFALLITIGCLAGASFVLSLALNRFAPSAGFYFCPQGPGSYSGVRS